MKTITTYHSARQLAWRTVQIAKGIFQSLKIISKTEQRDDWAQIIYLDHRRQLVRTTVRLQNMRNQTDQHGQIQTIFDAINRERAIITLSIPQVIEAQNLNGDTIPYFGEYVRELKSQQENRIS